MYCGTIKNLLKGETNEWNFSNPIPECLGGEAAWLIHMDVIIYP